MRWVGGDESEEYLRQSRSIVERWGEAGVRTRYEPLRARTTSRSLRRWRTLRRP
jgi:hypothetical protein